MWVCLDYFVGLRDSDALCLHSKTSCAVAHLPALPCICEKQTTPNLVAQKYNYIVTHDFMG